LHSKDELYDRLRGPAENVNVLATAYSDPEKNSPPWNDSKGTRHHESMLLTIDYGKGRVFYTTLGHTDYSMEGVGFIVTLQRGTEWAATGKITIPIPEDFPGEKEVSTRKWSK
jgi:type 1 glutamine amidotransferase